jgi:hypothetical protein
MADKQRISYVPLEDMTAEMRVEMERCARGGDTATGEFGNSGPRPQCLLVLREKLGELVPQRGL